MTAYSRKVLNLMYELLDAQGLVLGLNKNAVINAKRVYRNFLKKGGDPHKITCDAILYRETNKSVEDFVEVDPTLLDAQQLNEQNDYIERVLARN